MTTRKRALAVLIAAFLLGCLVGAAGFRQWGQWDVGRATFRSDFRGMDRLPQLEHHLQLTSDQQARLKDIYSDLRRQMDAHRADMDNQYETLRKETNNRIAAILTDEQKKRFEQYLKDAEGRRYSTRRGRGASGRTSPH
jgi:Spy/CpxP family protein refolding chaperone